MYGIVSNDWDPFTSFRKLTFQLHYETNNLAAFRTKTDMQSIAITQKTIRLDSPPYCLLYRIGSTSRSPDSRASMPRG